MGELDAFFEKRNIDGKNKKRKNEKNAGGKESHATVKKAGFDLGQGHTSGQGFIITMGVESFASMTRDELEQKVDNTQWLPFAILFHFCG